MRAYFDNGTTEIPCVKVKETIASSLLSDTGIVRDSSSFGKETLIALESCRYETASLLDCKTGELIFTSGGTEAMNQAIYSAVSMMKEMGRNHIIAGYYEPPSITVLLNQLEGLGFTVTRVMTDEYGRPDFSRMKSSLKPETGLLITTGVDEATGAIKPLEELSAFSRASDLLFISDLSLLAGRVPLSLHMLDIDFAVFSAHRFGGPQGIGMLYARNGVSVTPLIQGSFEEDGRRAGSLNTGLADGMKTALAEKISAMEDTLENVTGLALLLRNALPETGCIPVSPETGTVPGWVSFRVPGMTGERAVDFLEKRGFILSAAPYWNGTEEERPVRLLLSERNSEEEIKDLLNALYEIQGY